MDAAESSNATTPSTSNDPLNLLSVMGRPSGVRRGEQIADSGGDPAPEDNAFLLRCQGTDVAACSRQLPATGSSATVLHGCAATVPERELFIMLDDDMKRLVDEQRLGYVASVCSDGSANLSPKGTTAVWDDDHLVFAHLHSPQTVANIEAGTRSWRSTWSTRSCGRDTASRAWPRFTGTVPPYESGLRFYEERSGLAANRIKAIVLIKIDQTAPVISPAYDDGSTELDVERRSLKLYGLTRSHDS